MGYTVYAPYVFDIIMGQRVLRHGFGVYTTCRGTELINLLLMGYTVYAPYVFDIIMG